MTGTVTIHLPLVTGTVAMHLPQVCNVTLIPSQVTGTVAIHLPVMTGTVAIHQRQMSCDGYYSSTGESMKSTASSYSITTKVFFYFVFHLYFP